MSWLKKAKKDQISPNEFFFEKQLIKFSCTYWPLSFCKIFLKILGPICYEDVPFSGPKWPICNEQIFFGTNHYYYFNLPIGPFPCAKLKKILTVDPELWGCATFGPIFSRKPVNEPCFLYLCLYTSQKSKWDINLLKKYWRLKNTEISLVESFLVITSVLDFSQAWSFHRMLMNHSNFHFTQIPAETNVVFFKKSKNHVLGQFLTIFSQFCPMGILSKKSDCHTQLYMGP